MCESKQEQKRIVGRTYRPKNSAIPCVFMDMRLPCPCGEGAKAASGRRSSKGRRCFASAMPKFFIWAGRVGVTTTEAVLVATPTRLPLPDDAAHPRRSHSRCEASAFYLETAAEGRLCPPHKGEGSHFVTFQIAKAAKAGFFFVICDSPAVRGLGRSMDARIKSAHDVGGRRRRLATRR